MASYRQDNVEAVDALRLPLGGINGYVGVRGKQGRKKDKFQGTTPTKTRRTKHFTTAREAAVALAELTRRPREPDDPIAELDFGSPVCVAPFAPCVWSSGRRVVKPLRLELELRMCELPCVHVGMPMTAAQCSLALMCSMPLACALPCAPEA